MINAPQQGGVRPDMTLPTYDDFSVIKEAFLELGQQPDAVTRPAQNNGLYIGLERIYIDIDFLVWPPLSVCVTGLIRTIDGGSNKLLIRYRELAHNAATENSSVNHDYIFRTEEKELVEFGHSMRGAPLLPEPRSDVRLGDQQLNEARIGEKILRVQTGGQLELTAGDCGILFDRLMELQPSAVQ